VPISHQNPFLMCKAVARYLALARLSCYYYYAQSPRLKN